VVLLYLYQGQPLGGVAVSLAGATATYALGRVFTQHFDQGGTLLDFDPISSREYFEKEYERGRIFLGRRDLPKQKQVTNLSLKAGRNTLSTEEELLRAESEQLHAALLSLQETVDLLQSQSADTITDNETEVLFEENEPLGITTVNETDLIIIEEGIEHEEEKGLGAATVSETDLTIELEEEKVLKARGNFSFLDRTTWWQRFVSAVARQFNKLRVLKDKLLRGNEP